MLARGHIGGWINRAGRADWFMDASAGLMRVSHGSSELDKDPFVWPGHRLFKAICGLCAGMVISGWCNGNTVGSDPPVKGSNPFPDAYGSVVKRSDSRLQICLRPFESGRSLHME